MTASSIPTLSLWNKTDRLEEFAAQFDDAVLENLNWSEVFEKYDGLETVFYCDPPYVDQEGYYPVSEIDHAEFVAALGELEGDWVVSYRSFRVDWTSIGLSGKGSGTSWATGRLEVRSGRGSIW